MCLNLINPVTPYKDYLGQDFTELKHNIDYLLKLEAVNPILTHTLTS